MRGAAYVLGRAALFAALLLGACFLVFAALALLPGNAATQQLGLTATSEQVAALMHAYGLDLPLVERFLGWLAGALGGDFGEVLASGVPVAQALAGPLSRTAAMFGCSLALTCVLGVTLGTLAGMRAGGAADRVVSVLALAVRSTPEFVVGLALMYVLATTLHLLPAVSLMPVGGSAFDRPEIFVLPVLSMTVMGTCSVVRPVRAVVQRADQRVCVEAARLAGVSEPLVALRHVLPAAAAPTAQVLAGVVPYLVGGAVVIEKLFSFPGLGTLMVSAVQMREPNVLMACACVMLAASLASWWVADALGRAGGARDVV